MSNFSLYDYSNNRTTPVDVLFFICLMVILISCYTICYRVAGIKLRLALRVVLYAIIGLAIWFSLQAFVEYPLVRSHLNSYDITQHYFRSDTRAVTSTSLPGWAESGNNSLAVVMRQLDSYKTLLQKPKQLSGVLVQ